MRGLPPRIRLIVESVATVTVRQYSLGSMTRPVLRRVEES
jgi:hypothetical protein